MTKIEEIKRKIAQLPSADAFGKVQLLPLEGLPKSKIYPHPEHPRVMINSSMLEKWRTLLTHEDNRGAYEDYCQWVEYESDGVLRDVKEDDEQHWNYDDKELYSVEAKAFRYLMTGEAEYGYQAILAILNIILTLEITPSPLRYTKGYMDDSYHRFGYVLYVASEVYDWCFDLLGDAEREKLVAGLMTRIAPRMEMGFPPDKQGAITGHGSEGQFMNDWFCFALATFGEYPNIYEYVMGRLEKDYVPYREFYFKSGMQSQGNSYGAARFFSDLNCQYLARTGTGKDIFRVDLNAVAHSFIHNIRPDNTHLRLGDDMGQRAYPYMFLVYDRTELLTAALDHDPMAKSEAYRMKDNIIKYSKPATYFTGVKFLIWNDPTLGYEDYRTLPTYLYNGAPVCQIITRDSWYDENATMLYMKVGEYYSANHEHQDAGQFQIFYKGALAIDSGFYDAYGTPTDGAYTKRTIAHNCMLIKDPNSVIPAYKMENADCGGQNFEASESFNLEIWLDRLQTHRADEIGHEIKLKEDGNVRHAYISGDFALAYPGRAEEAKRYMYGVYTDRKDVPLVFFVYDKVTSTDPSFKKTYLLHFMNEPKRLDGREIVVAHNGGALVSRALLPADDKIEVELVEGTYVVNGENLVMTRPYKVEHPANERGWGRLEISAKLGDKTDYFLNAMYVTDEDKIETTEKAKLYENDALVGASLQGCAVFFPKGDELKADTELETYGDGEVYTTVAGLKYGTWLVVGEDGLTKCVTTATKDAGTLSFTAPAGKFRLLKR